MAEKKIRITIGAMAPSLAEQVKSQGVQLVLDSKTRDLFRAMEGDVDALNRLYVRGVLSETSTIQARKKLIKAVLSFVKKHGVIT